MALAIPGNRIINLGVFLTSALTIVIALYMETLCCFHLAACASHNACSLFSAV
jgi:hypothetical protein